MNDICLGVLWRLNHDQKPFSKTIIVNRSHFLIPLCIPTVCVVSKNTIKKMQGKSTYFVVFSIFKLISSFATCTITSIFNYFLHHNAELRMLKYMLSKQTLNILSFPDVIESLCPFNQKPFFLSRKLNITYDLKIIWSEQIYL